jgi:hypothetical protein
MLLSTCETSRAFGLLILLSAFPTESQGFSVIRPLSGFATQRLSSSSSPPSPLSSWGIPCLYARSDNKKPNTNVRKNTAEASDDDEDDDDDYGEVGAGPNWIERSFPVVDAMSSASDLKKVEDYDLGISGVSFQTGSLSKRKY